MFNMVSTEGPSKHLRQGFRIRSNEAQKLRKTFYWLFARSYEEREVLGWNWRQCHQCWVLKPTTLDDHLNNVHDTKRSSEPTFICWHVNHCLITLMHRILIYINTLIILSSQLIQCVEQTNESKQGQESTRSTKCFTRKLSAVQEFLFPCLLTDSSPHFVSLWKRLSQKEMNSLNLKVLLFPYDCCMDCFSWVTMTTL